MPDKMVDKQKNPVQFEWADSDAFVVDAEGTLVKAGTCVLLNGSIFFLTPLDDNQLRSFKETVVEAIDHELNKRLNP